MTLIRTTLISGLVVGAATLFGMAVDAWAKRKYGRVKGGLGNPADELLKDNAGINPALAIKEALPDLCDHCKQMYLFSLNNTKGRAS